MSTCINPTAIEEGNSIASNLFDASIQKSFDGKGGGKKFNLASFPENQKNLILDYVNEHIDSVTAIYLHMKKFDISEREGVPRIRKEMSDG